MTCSKIEEGLKIIYELADELRKLDRHEACVTDNAARKLFEKHGLTWESNCSDEEIREYIYRGEDPLSYLNSCPYEVLIKAWNLVKGSYFEEKQKEVSVIDTFLNNRAGSGIYIRDICDLMDYVIQDPEIIIPGLAYIHSSSNSLFDWNNEMYTDEMTAVRDLLNYYRQKYHKEIMSYRELFREMGTQTMWEFVQESFDYEPEMSVYLWYKEHDPGILRQKYYAEGIPGEGACLREFLKSQRELDSNSIFFSAMEKYRAEMGIQESEEDCETDNESDDDETAHLEEVQEHLSMLLDNYPMHVKAMVKDDCLVSYLMNEDEWFPEVIDSDGDYTYDGESYDAGLADYFRCMGETKVWSANEC